ncbi:MAG: hypothetical protein PHU24_02565 [Sphaerochaetaceae bacterium]|jgi:hypothetical protein|nr:hypothetical protein [Sphaerochaetaceae bacterium]NLO60525.1 hypothetical protein [Spirochaetales bacterium]MDD2405323.1 hypothetical protein [Sphaerochaetaceae bacterium]MDD3670477.1 hypothetical protein [Sphaerochaetaceae bacterium]MDD4258223.1 hypothetical protein [Sphaerochaetaceae bacterium]
MTGAKQQKLEDELRKMSIELDHHLEDMFGDRYPLHPNRLPRGKASSVFYDGLFSTGTKFTLGYGSKKGRGYLVDIEMSTLAKVDPKDRDEIENEAIRFLRTIVPIHFPNRNLEVVKDHDVYKIIGDFSLGTV